MKKKQIMLTMSIGLALLASRQPALAQLCPATFDAPRAFPAGEGPRSVASEDLNGDGDPDLAVANANSDDVSILLGNGDGTFLDAVSYPAGDGPISVATADLNGDGAADLAVANWNSGDVSILLGNGDGTFRAAGSYPAGNAPWSVAIGDLNGDGAPDLAVDNDLPGAVAVLLGNGDGTFQAGMCFPAGHAPWSVAIEDLNGDGRPDLAVGGRELAVLVQGGGAVFQPPDLYTGGWGGLSLAADDLNNDGAPDLAVASWRSDRVSILLNTTGSCISTVNFLAGEGLAAPNRNKVKVFDASGTSTPVSFLAYGAGQWGVNVAGGFIAVGGDASILTGPGPGAVYGPHVRGFSRTGTPMARVSFYAYGTLRYGVNVASGQVDVDSLDEILTGAGPGEIFGPHVRGFDYDGSAIAPIAGINFFAYKTLKYGVNPGSGDVDGDRYAEILTGPGAGSIFGPQVRGFNFDGGPLASISAINFNAFGQTGYGAVVGGGDVDADGYAEIAAALGPGRSHRARFLGYNYDGKKVSWLQGYDVTPYGTRYGGRLALADMDADNRTDLITGPGPDPAAQALVLSFSYDGSSLTQRPGSFTAFTSMYGVNVGAGSFGW